jgi:integrase
VALNQARKWELLSVNAAALVEPPRHTAKQVQPLTPEQGRSLLVAARGHRLGALVSVGTAVGPGIGEAAGVRWADIDLDAGTLSVTQAIERSGGDPIARRPMLAASRELRKQIAAAPKRSAERRQLRAELEKLHKEWRPVRSTLRVTEPKSARSRRTVRLPAVVLTALKAHRTQQRKERLAAGGAWEDSGLVFTSPVGSALDPRNVTREFKALLVSASLPDIRFHDLRHTAATLLLAQGVDPRTIMETLGHSQISLTMNAYSHVLPALQADAAARMNAILAGS